MRERSVGAARSATANVATVKRHPFDYQIEVCAVCGMGLSMGIGPSTGRCPHHAEAGGVVIRVRALPAFEQQHHQYAPREQVLSRLVRAGAIPTRSNEPNPAKGPLPEGFVIEQKERGPDAV